jgi:Condensation domain
VTGLSPEAQELLERRRAGRRADSGVTIPRRAPGEPVPLSFAQWRLWFLEQLRPGTNAWNTPVAARLRGPLDADALRRALAMIVERHGMLRTVFPNPEGDLLSGGPFQVMLEAPVVELPVSELEPADSPAETLSDRIDAFVAAEVRRPFDLTSDLMVRARLLRLGPEDHVFVLVAHHIACDGWSKGLLIEELGATYGPLVEGGQPASGHPAAGDPPIEYADFAVWQHRWLSGERLEGLNDYWRQHLAGHALALELATDKPRPRIQEFRGAVQWLALPGPVAQAVVALSRRERATPFMALMAGFMAVLHAQTGQDDLLVGSPAAMRNLPELQRVIGLFANTLVYRTDLSGTPSYRELIGRVRETALGVYQHQDLPFEKIVEALKPRRDASRNPLVQVNLRVEGAEPELRLSRLRCEPISLDPGIARFDLAIELGVTDDGYAGYLEYDTSLFEPATAAALARSFVSVLEAAVGSPDLPLVELAPMREIMAYSSRQ